MSSGFQLGRAQDDCDGHGAEAYELTTFVRGKIRGFNRVHRHSLLKDGEAADGYHRSRRLKHPLRALFVVVGILLAITTWCLTMAYKSHKQWRVVHKVCCCLRARMMHSSFSCRHHVPSFCC